MESNELQLHIEEIKNHYLNKSMSVSKMAEKYHCKRHQIYYILEKNNVPIRSNSEANRKYNINEHYFDVIDTPDKAYILGLLYADGYNNPKINSIVLSLDIKDIDLLESVKLKCRSNKPLNCYTYKHSDGYKDRHPCILTLSSKHMCETLSRHGLITNKSLVLEFPKFLPDELYSHFFRGYFDGDGCFHHNFKENKNLVQLTSSKTFCIEAQKYIQDKLNIKVTMMHNSGHTDQTWNLRIFAKADVKTFMNWIYSDADLFMKRKYDLYNQFVK